uniref:Uncharacterized protein n=1 Tax=Rhizophora mucronata TaxID=61149 RepID=A0A2P2PYC6_RHIMU
MHWAVSTLNISSLNKSYGKKNEELTTPFAVSLSIKPPGTLLGVSVTTLNRENYRPIHSSRRTI